jgi:hypothetical protein
MQKNFYSLLWIFSMLISGLQAQVSITQADMPSAGDTIRYSTVLTLPAFNRNATGANTNWDFSNLSPASQDVYEYRISGQTPYLFNFGFNAIGLKIADNLGTQEFALQNVYQFFQKNQTTFSARGLGFQISLFPLPLAGTYASEDVIYRFPLKYSDSFSKDFSLNIPLGTPPLSLGSFHRNGFRTTKVDGWGTISTPYVQNKNCVRVVSVINSRDSIALTGTQGGGFAFNTSEIEYKWLTPGEKIPLMEVRGTLIGNNFTPTQIRYRDQYRSLNNNASEPELLATSPISLYPNPVENILHLTDITHPCMASIWDGSGKLVYHSELHPSSSHIDLQWLPTGVYHLRLTHVDNQIILQHIILKK